MGFFGRAMARLAEVFGVTHSDLSGSLFSGLCIVLDCSGFFEYIWICLIIHMSVNSNCLRFPLLGRPIIQLVAIFPVFLPFSPFSPFSPLFSLLCHVCYRSGLYLFDPRWLILIWVLR